MRTDWNTKASPIALLAMDPFLPIWMLQSSAEATQLLNRPLQLLAYCKSVTLINRSDIFRADEITVEKVLKNPKMQVVKNAEILEITGDKFVEGIDL